jgi:hypothetical protein
VVINPKGKFQAAIVTIFTIPDLYLWSQPEKVVHIEREDLKIIVPILRFTLAGFAGTTNTLSPPRPTIDREDFPPKKKELRYLVTPFRKAGGQGRIRTFVHLREQIYRPKIWVIRSGYIWTLLTTLTLTAKRFQLTK